MKGIGILVNILAVLVGGGFGLMLRGKLKPSLHKLFYHLLGLAVMAVGAYEFIQHYFLLSGGEVELTGSLFVLLSLILGGLMGYLFNVSGGLTGIGKALSKKDSAERAKERARVERLARAVDLSIEKDMSPPKVSWLDKLPTYDSPAPLSDNAYADGFVLAVVLLCANSMLFNGTVADANSGETTLLLVKSLIDFIACFFLCLSFGSGAMYAVIPMSVLEAMVFGIHLVLPNFSAEFFDPALTAQLSLIGAVTLLILGIQMAFDRKKPKAADLLPSVLFPLLYCGILFLVNLLIGE